MDGISQQMDFMLYFNIFIGVYLLYYAIKGTGKIYENEYPKEVKEAHAKFLRKFCWIVGIAMIALTVLELNFRELTFLAWIEISFVGAAVVFYVIVAHIKFKQKKK